MSIFKSQVTQRHTRQFSQLACIAAIVFYSVFTCCSTRPDVNPLTENDRLIDTITLHDTTNFYDATPVPKGDADVSFSINLLGNPTNVVVGKNGANAYVTNNSGLLEIDLVQKKVIKNYPVPNSRLEITGTSSDGAYLSFFDFSTVYLAVISDSMRFFQTLSGSAVYSSCIANNTVYAPCFNDRVVRTYSIPTKTEGTINPYSDNSNVATPVSVCPTPDGKYVAAVDEGNNSIHIISTETNKVVSTIPTGKHANLVVALSNALLAATLESSDKLLIIPFKEPGAVPEIYNIDSLQYVHDLVFAPSTGKLFIILGIFSYDKSNAGFNEFSYFSIPQIICYDITTNFIVKKITPKVNASNVNRFKIAILPDDKTLLFTSTETLYGITTNIFQ